MLHDQYAQAVRGRRVLKSMATRWRWPIMPSYDDLTALFINCSLKRSTETSHTQKLMNVALAIMASQGVKTSTIRAADIDIAPAFTPT